MTASSVFRDGCRPAVLAFAGLWLASVAPAAADVPPPSGPVGSVGSVGVRDEATVAAPPVSQRLTSAESVVNAPADAPIDWRSDDTADPLFDSLFGVDAGSRGLADRLDGSSRDADADADELDLDELLDLVDEDVGHLSQVRVPAQPSGPVSASDTFHTVVSTVERKESTVGQTPAAVFVITGEMIRRSGVRTIPEALRLAPGVEVARIDANKWAISIRGFNNRFANKLLVQIDGRSVYNPLFGGTLWDVQDVLLEDVDRIEVVRGPGGTVWGDNAVNGVINVITKPAEETLGTLFQAGGGDLQNGFTAVRHGGQWGQRSHYRGYAKWFDRGSFDSPFPGGTDNWSQLRTGGRIDTQWSDADRSTIQGDVYTGYSGTTGLFPAPPPQFVRLSRYDEDVRGGNVLLRHTHTNADDSSWQLQAYFDRTDRKFTNNRLRYQRNTYSIDFQHRFSPARRHDIVWGADYQLYDDEFTEEPFFFRYEPAARTYDRVSAFVQDTIGLRDDLSLTLGTKLSHNDFTGFEVQPSARLLYTPSDTVSIWGAVSRAVRTAVRVNSDARLVFPTATPPVFPVLQADPNVEAEDLIAYELGYRNQVSPDLTFDIATYYNRYTNLFGVVPAGGIQPSPEGLIAPLRFVNQGTAEAWGGELAVTAQLTERWLLRSSWTHLQLDINDPSTGDSGDAPTNQFQFWSSVDLGPRWQLDVIQRFVGDLPNQGVDAYSTVDARLGWRPSDRVELFLVGRNLFDPAHPEFGDDRFVGARAAEVPREIYGGVTLRF